MIGTADRPGAVRTSHAPTLRPTMTRPHAADTGGPVQVRHDARAHRFETTVPGGTAFAEYRRADGVITFTHTEVPPEAQGHGVADALARAALDYARAEGVTIIPVCPFFAAFIRRHQEYAPLVRAPGTTA